MATQPTSPAKKGLRRLDPFLRANATQILLPISVVMATTGVMMFFRWFNQDVHRMHEWLGLSLVVAIVLHLLLNRLPLIYTIKQKRVGVFVAVVALVVVGFLVFQPPPKPNVGKLAAQALGRAPLKALPLTLNRSEADLNAQLQALGITPSDPNSSVSDLAQQIHQPANWLLMELLSKH